MSVKRPTSGGQTCDQEAAVQQTFHLERSSFFYLSILMVSTFLPHTAALNTDLPSGSEATPHESHLYYYKLKFTRRVGEGNHVHASPIPWLSYHMHGNLGIRFVHTRGGEERGMGYLQFSLLEGADHHLQAAVAHVHKCHVARLLVLSWQILLVKPVSKGSWRSHQWGI